MSLNIAALNTLVEAAIETQTVDMTQEGSSGGLMPEGYAMARMVTYIEFGKQPQEYQGQAKPAAEEFKVGFKLFGGPDNCYDGRFISTFDLAISNGTKANAKILFDRLNWANDLVHTAQGLGHAYLVPITVTKSKTSGKDTNRINIAGILPPIDPVSKGNYPVPEVTEADLKYFFFDHPTKETWDSLFVEGQWEDKKSKNVMQEKILTAINFPGSALEALISGVVLPDLTQAAPAETTQPVVTTPAMPTMPDVPNTPVAALVMPVMPDAPVV